MTIETILAAIIGGTFGGGVTLLVTYMQSKNNLKRDYIKIAHELALEEYRTHFEAVKIKGGYLKPLESHMAYYTLFVQQLKDSDFDLDKLKEFRKTHEKINQIYDEN